MRQDKAARMLGKMARGAGKLRGEFKGQAQPPVAEIEVEFAGALLIYRLATSRSILAALS